jgi:beta-glucosidase-like glycosyl hydrolase
MNQLPQQSNDRLFKPDFSTVQGFLVSDWGAVNQLLQSTDAERLYQSINAGVDMIMMGDKEPFQETIKNLIAGVKTGRVSDGRINDAVKRILRAKVTSILLPWDGVLALVLARVLEVVLSA